MTTSPPIPLDRATVDDLPDLPVDVDEIQRQCPCDRPEEEWMEPDEGEFDPTAVRDYDKWRLWQCKGCGSVWWEHRVREDYGDPRMDVL